MTMELLEPRSGSRATDLLPGSENPWVLNDGMSWAISLFMMLGNSARNPTSIFGQVTAIIGLIVAIQHMVICVLPCVFNVLTGRFGFVEHYPVELRAAKNKDGHTVVTGSPTAKTLWDFLTEFYHPNHFSSGGAFDREAQDVVVFLENTKTLYHLKRMLNLKEAIMFRSRVFMVRGQALNKNDWEKIGPWKIARVVVLPDVTTSNTEKDDQLNIMRTYAMCSISASITATCLLHSAAHQGSMLSGSTPNSNFVSIDAIKMNLLGKACMFPGAMALICNLCVSVGENKDKYAIRRHWLADYERGLDIELYEMILTDGYHGATFQQIFEDILNRSNGATYLIGITDLGGNGVHGREVMINPGPDYQVKISSGRTAGVFMASDVDAISQMTPGEELLCSQSKEPKRLPRFERDQAKLVDPTFVEANVAQNLQATFRPISAKSLTSNASLKSDATDFDGKKVSRANKLRQRETEKIMGEVDEKYDKTMLEVKTKLMEKGLKPDLIADATNTLPFQRRFPRTNIVDAKEEDSGSDGEGEESQAIRAEAQAKNDFQAKIKELQKLEAKVERVRKDCTGERKPARSILSSGGHVLLLLVGDTEVSSIPIGSSKLTGSLVGINCFMKALRDKRLELNQGTQPPVVVVSELQPADWHMTADMERVYYIAGNPCRSSDLLRAGIRTCKAIVIARMHNGPIGGIDVIADARLVLAATTASFLLPSDKIVPIITDHAYAGSCDLLPKERVFVEDGPLSQSSLVGPPAELPRALKAIFAGPKVLARSTGLDGKPPPIIDVQSLFSGKIEDKYEELEKFDIKYHPRYLRGQVFHPSAVASMVANSVYNPTLIAMVDALIESPMMLVDVPKVWFQCRYSDFAIWLLRERELLALGLYRNAEASQSAHTGDYLDDTAPTHWFVYTAPPGSKTLLVKTDQVIATAVGTRNSQPTKIGSLKQQQAMEKAIKHVYADSNKRSKEAEGSKSSKK